MLAIGGVVVASTVASGGGDQETRMAGLLAMSVAGMLIAVPMYVEARRLQSTRMASVIKKGKARGAAKCASCDMDTAAFWCTTHLARLCADCVPKHDEPSRCLYKSLVQVRKAAAGQ